MKSLLTTPLLIMGIRFSTVMLVCTALIAWLPTSAFSAAPTSSAPALACPSGETLIGEFTGTVSDGTVEQQNMFHSFSVTSEQHIHAVYSGYEDGELNESFRTAVRRADLADRTGLTLFGSYIDSNRTGWSAPQVFPTTATIPATIPYVLQVQLSGSLGVRDISYKLRLCGNGGTTLPTETPSPVNTVVGAAPIPTVMGLSEGQTLHGSVAIELHYAVATTQIRDVVFAVSGPTVFNSTENKSPYVFLGDGNSWNTTTAQNGSYIMRITTTTTDGKQSVVEIHFSVNNSAHPTATPGNSTQPTATMAMNHPTASPASDEPPLLPFPNDKQNGGLITIIKCRAGPRINDDPIVFPGHPGMSHQHQFYGNTTINGNSTYDSMVGKATTCDDANDTAAYWVPTIYDEQGNLQTASAIKAYYYANGSGMRAFPPNLRFIAGSARATGLQPFGVVDWLCRNRGDLGPGYPLVTTSPPTCKPTQVLSQSLRFPDCWDGVHLDSSDHKRHMAYAINGHCPATHPVKVPKIRLSIIYGDNDFGNFTLGGKAGDPMALPWYAFHGDFWNTWVQSGLESRLR